MKTVEEYLEGQSVRGVYDSTDVFTLDTLRMGRKMAAFQLGERGLWLVKLVQAAVTLQAPELSIQFQKRRVSVRFLSSQAGPSAQELLSRVFHSQPKTTPTLQHMVASLRACVGQDTELLRWEVRGPDGGDWVELSDDSTRAGDCESSQGESWEYTFQLQRPAQGLEFKRALRQRCVDLVREVGDEYVAVLSRCWCAPLCLQLDGVDLKTGIPHPAMRHLTDCELVGCGVDRYHMGDHWLALRPLVLEGCSADFPTAYWQQLTTAPDFEVSDPVRPKECFLRWPELQGGNGLLLVSFSSLAQPGVDFILDGAVVDQVDFPYPRGLRPTDRLLPAYQRQAVGFRLFVAVNPDQVDLSGFGVREKPDLARSLLEQARKPLLDTIGHLEDYLDHYNFAPARAKEKGRWLDRVLAPIARFNQGFTKSEIERTLGQLRDYCSTSEGNFAL